MNVVFRMTLNSIEIQELYIHFFCEEIMKAQNAEQFYSSEIKRSA